MRSEKVIPLRMILVLALLALLYVVSFAAPLWAGASLIAATICAMLAPCLALVGVMVIGAGEGRGAPSA